MLSWVLLWVFLCLTQQNLQSESHLRKPHNPYPPLPTERATLYGHGTTLLNYRPIVKSMFSSWDTKSFQRSLRPPNRTPPQRLRHVRYFPSCKNTGTLSYLQFCGFHRYIVHTFYRTSQNLESRRTEHNSNRSSELFVLLTRLCERRAVVPPSQLVQFILYKGKNFK